MRLWHEIRHRFDRVTKSYRFRQSLFSLFFGVCVIAIYYFISGVVPDDYLMHNQMVTILFIIVAVLVLFPAREHILMYVMRRNEYTSFFGRDFHHLDVVARQFSVETLVGEVFPEFMEWLGVRHGRIAILNPGRRYYDYHIYRNGQVHRGRHVYERSGDLIGRSLKNYHRSVHVHEFGLPRELRRRMESVGAVLIHPFSYRNRLLGFLILNEAPRNRHAARALDFFGDKAAVSIQNYILSNRIIDSRLYDQELRSAQKIQSTLHDAPIPEIPGFRLLRRDHQSCILEFIPAGRDGRWFLVGLTLDRITSAGGIILYGLLGHLYSFITREKNVTMHRLHSYLRKHREQAQADYPVDIVIAELVPKKRAIVLMSDGSNYNLRSLRDPNQPLVTRGWRNSLELSPGDGLLLSHAGSPLLELHYADLAPALAAAVQQDPSREV